jgi:hypothetical protein
MPLFSKRAARESGGGLVFMAGNLPGKNADVACHGSAVAAMVVRAAGPSGLAVSWSSYRKRPPSQADVDDTLLARDTGQR